MTTPVQLAERDGRWVSFASNFGWNNMRWTVGQILLLVALAALNLSAAIATSRHYPRPKVAAFGGGGAYWFVKNYEDGSSVYYKGTGVGAFPDPHLINPPRPFIDPYMLSPPHPSLLRIWSTVIASATVSFLAIIVAIRRRGVVQTSRQRLRSVVVAVSTIWLSMPLAVILCNPKDDYHVHEGDGIPHGRSVHASPFWPRYRRLLLGQTWPSDYACPTPPGESLPGPEWGTAKKSR